MSLLIKGVKLTAQFCAMSRKMDVQTSYRFSYPETIGLLVCPKSFFLLYLSTSVTVILNAICFGAEGDMSIGKTFKYSLDHS